MVGLVKAGAFVDKAEFEGKVNHFLSADYNGEPLKTERASSSLKYYIYAGILLLGLLLLIGRWGILRKAGKKGWHSLIPLLNAYQEYSTVWNGWIGVIAALCFPIGALCNLAKLPSILYFALVAAGILISIPESIRLAKAFGKGKVLGVLMAFPVFKQIGRLLLGVSKARFQAPDANGSAG